jgi:hypothetical protein
VINPVGRPARLALAMVAALLANGSLIGSVAAAGDIATTIEIQSITANVLNPVAPFVPIEFHLYANTAGVTDPAPTGTVRIMETTTGTPVEIASESYPGNYSRIWTITYQPGFDIGTHTFKAVWEIDTDPYIDSESAPVDYTVSKDDSFIFLSGNNVLEAHHSLHLDAPIGASSSAFATNATVKIFQEGNATALCTVPVSTENSQGCTLTFNTAGSYSLTAVYSGNTWVTGSTSDPAFVVTVNPDVLHVSGVGIDVATFYPYKDSYRDSVIIRGSRTETVGGTAKIYSPGGSLLKTITISRGIGAYSTSWNGRNSSGTIYAEGKYKIVQTLSDNAGTTKAFTNYVNLSKKRLVTTTKSITKLGSSLNAKGTAGTGTISISTSAGTAVVKAGSAGAAAVGYEFTLPTATTYTSLKFRIYAKAGYTIPYQSEIAMQSFAICGYVSGAAWDATCFNHWATIGSFGTTGAAWWPTSGHPTNNRSGTRVRGMLNVPQGSVTVYKAQIVVTYGVLKY